MKRGDEIDPWSIAKPERVGDVCVSSEGYVLLCVAVDCIRVGQNIFQSSAIYEIDKHRGSDLRPERAMFRAYDRACPMLHVGELSLEPVLYEARQEKRREAGQLPLSEWSFQNTRSYRIANRDR